MTLHLKVTAPKENHPLANCLRTLTPLSQEGFPPWSHQLCKPRSLGLVKSSSQFPWLFFGLLSTVLEVLRAPPSFFLYKVCSDSETHWSWIWFQMTLFEMFWFFKSEYAPWRLILFLVLIKRACLPLKSGQWRSLSSVCLVPLHLVFGPCFLSAVFFFSLLWGMAKN